MRHHLEGDCMDNNICTQLQMRKEHVLRNAEKKIGNDNNCFQRWKKKWKWKTEHQKKKYWTLFVRKDGMSGAMER